MQKICKNCSYIGLESKYNELIFFVALFGLIYSGSHIITDFGVTTFWFFVYVAMLLASIYCLILYFVNRDNCPNCNHPNTMIEINTLEGRKLITDLYFTDSNVESIEPTESSTEPSSSPFQSPK